MKLKTIGILALAASASAISSQLVKNFCKENVYLTLAVKGKDTLGPFSLKAGEAYISNITGEGNTVTVTKDDAVFTSIAKLIMGTSTDEQILYWSVNNVTGDPFYGEHFNVTSAGPDGTTPGICQNTDYYDGMVHACADNQVTLTLSLCPLRALQT